MIANTPFRQTNLVDLSAWLDAFLDGSAPDCFAEECAIDLENPTHVAWIEVAVEPSPWDQSVGAVNPHRWFLKLTALQ